MSDGPQIGSYDPKNLEGRADGEGNNSFRPREFFWDSVTLYVVSAIIGLAAIDVVTEFLRGSSSIACTPLGNRGDITEADYPYINGICSQILPRTEIFPAFIVVHGILLLIPHYLWLNHYGGSFDFFFSQTSQLDRLRSEDMGEYSDKNRLILQQLTAAFSTYKQNWMFVLYVLKLAFQLFLSLAGFFVAVFVFTDFRDTFLCDANSTSAEIWPLGQDDRAMCVFTSLRLFALLRIADLILVSLLILCFMWSLLWSIGVHPTELGTDAVARFVFEGGMLPEHYISNLQIGWCCEPCRRFLYWLFAKLPLLSLRGPRIATNLDFLVMKLFRTDSGLGFVFRELQVLKKVEQINGDERRIVALHRRQQRSLPMGNGVLVEKIDVEADLKWRMEKEPKKPGLFKKYEQLPNEKVLCIPNSIRGAILGFSNCAPANRLALYLTFGSPSMGIATALARVFGKVGIINFNPYYKVPDPENNKKPITVRIYSDTICKFVAPVDVLSSETQNSNAFKETLRSSLWKPRQSVTVEASFIAVGPLDNPSYKSTVSLFLTEMTGHIADNCVLVMAHPEEVGGKRTGQQFHPYTPPQNDFQALPLNVYLCKGRTLMWPPKTQTPPTNGQILTMTEEGLQFSLTCGNLLCQFNIGAFYFLPLPESEPTSLEDNSDGEHSTTSEGSNESSDNSLEPLVPTQPTATVPGQADLEMKPVTTEGRGSGGEKTTHVAVPMDDKV